jgi:DNA end-binding protein Ku
MAVRPFWSGQLRLSLVSFGIHMFPATESENGVAFHQIDRSSGQRIHHLNVVDHGEPVENSEIVKGYEYRKGKYVIVEPDEIAKLRIQTKNVIEISQFVTLDELAPSLFEKPYFVTPDPRESADAFAVVRKAMEQAGKAALGEVAFGGREHLVAIAVPPDTSEPGLMAYMLRYAEELRSSKRYFSGIPNVRLQGIDKKQLAMARELIEAYSSPLNLDSFKDDYEFALRELIEAKQKSVPIPIEEEKPKSAKVINLMDALRQSVTHTKHSTAGRKSERMGLPKKGQVSATVNRRKRKAA